MIAVRMFIYSFFHSELKYGKKGQPMFMNLKLVKYLEGNCHRVIECA